MITITMSVMIADTTSVTVTTTTTAAATADAACDECALACIQQTHKGAVAGANVMITDSGTITATATATATAATTGQWGRCGVDGDECALELDSRQRGRTRTHRGHAPRPQSVTRRGRQCAVWVWMRLLLLLLLVVLWWWW